MKPKIEALSLLMQGAIAMSRIERTGLRIDVPYLDQAIKDTKQRILDMEEGIRKTDEYKAWSKHYGSDMSFGSPAQLGHVIFDIMGHKRNPMMKGNDVDAFEHVQTPFVKDYFNIKRLDHALTTNLMGIKKEVVNGRVHPDFPLNFAVSYRGSSRNPNFQNQPIRNKEISQIVRSCVIPDEGDYLLEADYGAQEVRVATCYNNDPKLISYILGGGDMHKDRALELFMLTEEELGPTSGKAVGADIRYVAKNKFVFPQFYGSVASQCAPDLWDAISLMDLKTATGQSLYSHLTSKGIKKLGACDFEQEPRKGTFEYHVREVERRMWEECFAVYHQWKKDWWTKYQKQGYFESLTGFVYNGVFRRNQVLSYSIQGSAFHCLLWSIIEIQKELIRKKMKTKCVLQVHDSLMLSVPRNELQDVVEMFSRIAVKEVAKHYTWINIPLQVEYDLAEKNWYSKVSYKGAT